MGLGVAHGEGLVDILLGLAVVDEEEAFDVVVAGEVETVALESGDDEFGENELGLAEKFGFINAVGGWKGVAGVVDVAVHLIDTLAVGGVIAAEARLLVVDRGEELPSDAVGAGAGALNGLFINGNIGLEESDLGVAEDGVAGVVGVIAVETARGVAGAADGFADQLGEEFLAGSGGVDVVVRDVECGIGGGGIGPVDDVDVAVLCGLVDELVVDGVILVALTAGFVASHEKDLVVAAGEVEEGVDLVLGEGGVVGAEGKNK